MYFQPEDRQWKCMCGLVHVITGAIVLAIIGIIFGILSIVGIFFTVPICALMLYGVKKERQGFIIPYLILGILMIIFSIIIFILYVYRLATIHNYVDKYYAEHRQEFDEETNRNLNENKDVVYGLSYGYSIFVVVCAGLSVFLHIYFWYVVLQAYKFIQAKKAAIASGTYQAYGYGAPTATVVTYQNNAQPQAVYTQPYPAQPAYPTQSPPYKN